MAKGYRSLHPGMGQAVAERTILRRKDNGKFESWGDVAARVALGNSKLCQTSKEQQKEHEILQRHIANATLLMSGRHLQHGDETECERNMEVFTNCATAPCSFLEFYLLMNGSGVGRCYDDDLMLVNWDNAPNLICVIDENHPDFDLSAHQSKRAAIHQYGKGKDILWFTVPDSREGWATALEIYENGAFQKIHRDKLLILDFSEVREKGKPIKGMQNRPSSGPVSLINAFQKASTIKGAKLEPWKQSLYIDHYFAECVLVGGARRSARMATKVWTDDSILDFIRVKRPIELEGKTLEETVEYLDSCGVPPSSFLWSANNSVVVDDQFWKHLNYKRGSPGYNNPKSVHARKVFKMVSRCAYGDRTGEPGFINVHKLTQNDKGRTKLLRGDYVVSKKFELREETDIFMSRLAKRASKKTYYMIVNPCSEIVLNILGGFCTIADVVPFYAKDFDDAEDAFRAATRALIRVNTMDSIYGKEVSRTNRIGVGMTGVHEFAWRFFKFGFHDLIDEEKSKEFWLLLARFNRAVRDESISYSDKLGLETPHTCTTIKPAGTTSKLFGLTEGWHLPAKSWYLRWVQFRHDDPLVGVYKEKGYPVRNLVKYEGTSIVGFPTAPAITTLGMGEKLVTAAEATPEEQYQWLMLGEKYWIHGTDEYGESVKEEYGNQISYTLKYKPENVSYHDFQQILREFQSQIRCCSVMPQIDAVAYEYQPEQGITKAEYEELHRNIQHELGEDIGKEHLDCDTQACPVDFKEEK